MDIYQPPDSELVETKAEEKSYWRPLWFLVLCHLYFWPKLIDYVFLYSSTLQGGDLEFLAHVSLNIPIYIAIFAYLFRLKLFKPWFWKVWAVLATADEVIVAIESSFGIVDFFIWFPYYLVPLYFFAAVYAFGAREIWDLPSRSSPLA